MLKKKKIETQHAKNSLDAKKVVLREVYSNSNKNTTPFHDKL